MLLHVERTLAWFDAVRILLGHHRTRAHKHFDCDDGRDVHQGLLSSQPNHNFTSTSSLSHQSYSTPPQPCPSPIPPHLARTIAPLLRSPTMPSKTMLSLSHEFSSRSAAITVWSLPSTCSHCRTRWDLARDLCRTFVGVGTDPQSSILTPALVTLARASS